jgi:hypothetical protein
MSKSRNVIAVMKSHPMLEIREWAEVEMKKK